MLGLYCVKCEVSRPVAVRTVRTCLQGESVWVPVLMAHYRGHSLPQLNYFFSLAQTYSRQGWPLISKIYQIRFKLTYSSKMLSFKISLISFSETARVSAR